MSHNISNAAHSPWKIGALASVAATLLTLPVAAQFPGLTLPPGGDNQKSVVTQHMGFASVTVTYNSPDVTGPNGDDRTGKIWGQLVPYGMAPAGFGNTLPTPWRAGANENTVVTLSHDLEVEGKPLAAGSYGLHMVPGESEWEIIFSHKYRAWGSFFHDPADDALRVTVKPEAVEFREWLTYDPVDRDLDSTVIAMHWENLRVPIRFQVPDMVDRYVEIIREELTGSPGFAWQNWNAAAQFLVNRDTDNKYIELAEQWAEAAVNAPFVGQKNFQTLTTRALVQRKAGQGAAAMESLLEAVDTPTATAGQIHQLGRQMITMGEADDALKIFEKSFKRFDGAWPTHVGMARGLSAVGRYDDALKHAKAALEQAPDELNKGSLENMIKSLKDGQDVN